MLDPFLHSPLYSTLKQFDSTEANLEKLEQLWKDIRDRIPKDIAYVQDPEYDELCQWFMDVYNALPRIDGWKPEIHLYDLNEIASMRLDARELGEIDAVISVEESIDLPGRIISEYRRRFNKKRRELVRNVVFDLISRVDTLLNTLSQTYLTSSANLSQRIDSKEWDTLQNIIQQIEALIGKNISSLPRWGDLRRHLRFGQIGDLSDIVQLDWPKVKDSLRSVLYDPHEAIPVEVDDLGTLVDAARSQEQVVKKLNWSSLSSEEFERLIFTLISDAEGYENPQWLTRTNAPDRGRDISVTRVLRDALSGTIRSRVIVQCKHWPSRSIGVREVIELKEQMKLWEPPPVDVLIIATTGRFSGEAVAWIDSHNRSGHAPRIEMWADSHLELILSKRPEIVAEFRLR